MKSAGELSQNAPYDKIVNNKYAENIKKITGKIGTFNLEKK